MAQFRHPHVVRLLGVVTVDTPVSIKTLLVRIASHVACMCIRVMLQVSWKLLKSLKSLCTMANMLYNVM